MKRIDEAHGKGHGAASRRGGSRLVAALAATLAAGLLVSFATGARDARAADPLKVGVLIPGSKTDKGWMESGYDGLKRAEAKHGDKIKVTFVENVKFADMEQALTMLATKSDLVIGVGGQTQASVYKVAKRFPKIKFSIVGGNKAEPESRTSRSTTSARPRSPSWPARPRRCCRRRAASATWAGWRSRPSSTPARSSATAPAT